MSNSSPVPLPSKDDNEEEEEEDDDNEEDDEEEDGAGKCTRSSVVAFKRSGFL